MIVRGVNNYTVCGQTSVGQGTKLFDVAKLGAGAYMLPIDMTPQCLNPQNRYTLFINSVNATSVPNPGFTPNGGSSRQDLHVSEVALVTNGPGNAPNKNAPVVYFYGTVRNARGVVRTGTTVTVKSEDGKYSDVGQTKDLYWQPKGAPTQQVGFLGFYYVTIVDAGSNGCADHPERYDFYVGGQRITSFSWSTPPYALSNKEDLFASLAP